MIAPMHWLALAVGFQQVMVGSMPVAVWYPSDSPVTPHMTVAVGGLVTGHDLPLIIISHGTGGSNISHRDLALRLAQAGYIVAALTHPGDNYQDQSATGSNQNLIDRPRHLHQLLDYMVANWPVDSTRVGVFGFSLGGFAALVAIGGTPDLRQLPLLCRERPDAPECGFIAQHHASTTVSLERWDRDPRIKAAVIAAPAVAVMFRGGGLKHVTVPVQLWRAQNDTNAPDAWNSGVVRAGLPTAPEEHVIPHAGHLVFTVFCGHECVDWTAPVVTFFNAHLTSR
jgi:predicted dienelactone hydrolase